MHRERRPARGGTGLPAGAATAYDAPDLETGRTRMTSRSALPILLMLFVAPWSAGPAGAGECVGARNNPAFSTGAATGATDPCRPAGPIAPPAPKPGARPAAQAASALDVPAAPKKPAATVATDAQGRTVYRDGNTEVTIGGYVRMDLSTRSR